MIEMTDRDDMWDQVFGTAKPDEREADVRPATSAPSPPSRPTQLSINSRDSKPEACDLAGSCGLGRPIRPGKPQDCCQSCRWAFGSGGDDVPDVPPSPEGDGAQDPPADPRPDRGVDDPYGW